MGEPVGGFAGDTTSALEEQIKGFTRPNDGFAFPGANPEEGARPCRTDAGATSIGGVLRGGVPRRPAEYIRRWAGPFDGVMRSLVVVWSAVAIAGAASVHAQDGSVATGLRLNVHVGAAVLPGGDQGVSSVSPGFSASYGNSRVFSAFVRYDRARMNGGERGFDLRHLDAGGRVHLRDAAASLVPFVLAAYTWREAAYGTIAFMGDTVDVKVHGSGVTLGAGAAYHIRRRLAVEWTITRTGGAMDRVDANGFTFRQEEWAIREPSYRIAAGISWWIPR